MPDFSIRIIISVLAVLAMTAHLTKQVKFEPESLILLGIAILPWLPSFVKSFKFGDNSIEFRLLEVEKKADAAKDAALYGVGKKNPAGETSGERGAVTENSQDPEKGKWGNSPSVNHRLLSARIEKIPDENYFRRLVLRVESTNPKESPLQGTVKFHLHPTFPRHVLEVPVENGVAETSLVSYGAFTLGAEADNGNTKLELDLTSLDDGKDQFFKR